MTNLREISHYLDIEINIEVKKKISLYQTIYFIKKLEYFRIADYKLASIFISTDITNSLFSSENQAD